MCQIRILCAFTLFFVSCSFLTAQENFPDWLKLAPKEYTDCSAIFFDGQMLVSEYSPNGKCRLEEGMKGKLTLSAVELSDNGAKATRRLSFQVAIHNERTNTLRMFTREPITEVQFEDVFKACSPGDAIIFLTVDIRYTLPHHKIEVGMGC
jgi:hypothetical protein